MRVSDYFLIAHYDYKILCNDVQAMILKGWEPHGSLCSRSGSSVVIQAMVKYTDKEVPAIATTL